MNAFTSFLKKVAVNKGTVSVISSDPSCKDDNARFTTVSLKHMIKNVEDIVVFLIFQWFISYNFYMYFCSRNAHKSLIVDKIQLKLIINIDI